MVGSIAYYSTGEWRLRKFESPIGPDLTHASSYRTLLYGSLFKQSMTTGTVRMGLQFTYHTRLSWLGRYERPKQG